MLGIAREVDVAFGSVHCRDALADAELDARAVGRTGEERETECSRFASPTSRPTSIPADRRAIARVGTHVGVWVYVASKRHSRMSSSLTETLVFDFTLTVTICPSTRFFVGDVVVRAQPGSGSALSA